MKFIRCDVCNYMAASAFDQADKLSKSADKKVSFASLVLPYAFVKHHMATFTQGPCLSK